MVWYVVIVGLFLVTRPVFVQGQSDATTFEVASVKHSNVRLGDRYLSAPSVTSPGGRWSARNAPLSAIVRSLYDVRPEQIVGAPPWFDTELFVIEARAANAEASRQQLLAMAKHLLADRFNLRLHIEQRPAEIYALVLTRSDGRTGPGLRPTMCVARSEGQAPEGNTTRPICGTWTTNVTDEVWQFRMKGFSLRTMMILHRVETVLGASVADRTGLKGEFDIDLEYVPEAKSPVNVLAAIQDQLGLKIERRREPMDVIVIDSVDYPTSD